MLYINIYTPKYKYNINEKVFIYEILNIYIDGDKLSMELKGKEKVIGTYYFENVEEINNFKSTYLIGDKILIDGELSIPKNNTIPNTFNYKKYLLSKNIHHLVTIKSIEKISSNKSLFNNIKNYVNKRIEKVNKNEYLYAFILGNGKYLPSEVSNNYRLNSITHLFSLSGLHVTIFALFISKILYKLDEKKLLIVISLFLLLICFITSYSPAIVRSVIFYILLSLNKIYNTNVKTIHLLYITFSITIFINPFYIYNLGYVLSFSATYFLILSNETIKINNKIYSLFIMSLIATLGSLPIIINNFYKINIVGFINNIFFVPYVSYIVYPVSLLSFLIPFLTPLLNILTNIMEYISRISSNVLNITLSFPKMSSILIIIYYLLFIMCIKYKKKITIIFLILFIFIMYNKNNFYKETYIYYIDVGQGDSILIRTENNKSILIDTGGKETFYKTIKRNNNYNLMTDSIIPFFNSIGIRKIDYLFLTHGDADHSGYAINLVKNIKVNNVVFNKGEYNDLELDLINVIKEKNIPYYKNINKLNIDSNILYSLNTKDYDNENDNSNVIYFINNNYKFLFMGDAGVERENDILNKYNLKTIDFIKVGHHGSKTSSSKEFIDRISPKYSIISVGEDNKFGHPKDSVLDILKESKIYRTDKNGSIEIKLNNNGYEIKTYSSMLISRKCSTFTKRIEK